MSASNRLGLPIRSAIEAELDMIDNIYNETATQASRLTEALARMRLDGGGGSYHAAGSEHRRQRIERNERGSAGGRTRYFGTAGEERGLGRGEYADPGGEGYGGHSGAGSGRIRTMPGEDYGAATREYGRTSHTNLNAGAGDQGTVTDSRARRRSRKSVSFTPESPPFNVEESKGRRLADFRTKAGSRGVKTEPEEYSSILDVRGHKSASDVEKHDEKVDKKFQVRQDRQLAFETQAGFDREGKDRRGRSSGQYTPAPSASAYTPVASTSEYNADSALHGFAPRDGDLPRYSYVESDSDDGYGEGISNSGYTNSGKKVHHPSPGGPSQTSGGDFNDKTYWRNSSSVKADQHRYPGRALSYGEATGLVGPFADQNQDGKQYGSYLTGDQGLAMLEETVLRRRRPAELGGASSGTAMTLTQAVSHRSFSGGQRSHQRRSAPLSSLARGQGMEQRAASGQRILKRDSAPPAPPPRRSSTGAAGQQQQRSPPPPFPSPPGRRLRRMSGSVGDLDLNNSSPEAPTPGSFPEV